MPARYNIGGPSQPPKGVIRSTYDTLTSPDNASVVRSVAAFGVGSPHDDPRLDSVNVIQPYLQASNSHSLSPLGCRCFSLKLLGGMAQLVRTLPTPSLCVSLN